MHPHPSYAAIALAPCNQLPHRRLSILVSQEQYDRHRLQYARFHRAKSGEITVRFAGWRRSRLLSEFLGTPGRPTVENTLDFRPDATSVPPGV